MRQTAPRQMMVNGHLHQVQDLESFNKLRSQENSRQASVAAQTSGPLSRLPMSAEQAQQTYLSFSQDGVVPTRGGPTRGSLVSSFNQSTSAERPAMVWQPKHGEWVMQGPGTQEHEQYGHL